ncbi:MAG: type II toxin-antitoxin system VapC family toxin [archaeon]
MKRFYIDTSIWMDLYYDREGYAGEPLGDYAFRLFDWIRISGHKIVISDLLIQELENSYSMEQINGMMKPFERIIEKVISSTHQKKASLKIAEARQLPRGDVLHAVLARDNGFTLITRDNHFRRLKDVAESHKPEDFI